MVGGGEGAFIGAVHRSAAGLDNTLDLVCGAFASDAERSRRSGASLGLPPERCYADFDSMFAAEAKMPADKRMEFVAIVTPNDLHLAVATAAFKHGFHVLSDKPATTNPRRVLRAARRAARRAAASTASRIRTARIRSSSRPPSACAPVSSAPCARSSSSTRKVGSPSRSSAAARSKRSGGSIRNARALAAAWATSACTRSISPSSSRTCARRSSARI